jgi:hypothetical protein
LNFAEGFACDIVFGLNVGCGRMGLQPLLISARMGGSGFVSDAPVADGNLNIV